AVSALALLAEEHFKSAALGNLGSTLWNGSVIVIAIPMVGWLAGLLRRILPGIWKAEGQMAAESLFRSVRRTGGTAAAIALVLTDGAFDPVRYPADWYREGNADEAARALRAGTGLLVSTTLSDRFDLHLGDRIRLPTPTGELDLAIVGVVPDYVGDRGSVIV